DRPAVSALNGEMLSDFGGFRRVKAIQPAAGRMQIIVDGYESAGFIIWIRVDGAKKFAVVKYPRPRDDRAHPTAEFCWKTELHSVAGNLPEKLSPPAEWELFASQFVDFGELLVYRLIFPEEVAVFRTESAKLAAEHGFANVAIRCISAALSIKQLFGP